MIITGKRFKVITPMIFSVKIFVTILKNPIGPPILVKLMNSEQTKVAMTVILLVLRITHQEMYDSIFFNGQNNSTTNNKDGCSLSWDESTHKTHVNVTPQIVNLIDYIGPEFNQKYPFVFPSYLHNNSQDGISRLVGLLRLSGAHGNFNLISNGYEKKREGI